MAPVVPDPRRVRTFASEAAFEKWLAAHHDSEPEIWIKIHKKHSGLRSVTPEQAVDTCLCWGWIDGIRKAFDERSFLQRYTPRGRRSTWSQVNRKRVERLVATGRMTPHGQRHVDAARADGRWDAAYAPFRDTSEATIPDDLRAAILSDPRATKTYRTLDKANLFALAYRTNTLKTSAGRGKKIVALVAMLARGETIVPIRSTRPKPRPSAGREGP
jgi:uncharacterized protein YdeI (YjbR/CyaY-like superfamily)